MSLYIKSVLLSLLLLTACNQSSLSESNRSFTAKVIGVKDGDTIDILHKGKKITVRLTHIDCPELRKNQPFGRAAKQFTSDLCFGKTVTIQGNDHDRYKRLLAEVITASGKNVNQELVRAGLAWHYKKFSSSPVYERLEQEAKKAKRGLWADPHPIPPWEWRRPAKHKQRNTPKKQRRKETVGFFTTPFKGYCRMCFCSIDPGKPQWDLPNQRLRFLATI